MGYVSEILIYYISKHSLLTWSLSLVIDTILQGVHHVNRSLCIKGKYPARYVKNKAIDLHTNIVPR